MKIDTTQIPNFDALPDDAKTAILGMEFADAPDMSKFVEKSVFDKKASEASELSKQLKAKMTDDEKNAAEREAKLAEMEAKLAALEREKLESTYKASYLAMGYEEKLAQDTAKALADGDMSKVFENQKKAAEAAEKRIKDELTRKDPRPGGAGGGDGKTEDAGVELARKLGKAKADAQKDSNNILKNYL